MSKKDLYFYIWAFPFIGAFLGFIINILLQTGNDNAGIVIMLGCIAGFLALISLVLGEEFSDTENSNSKDNKSKDNKSKDNKSKDNKSKDNDSTK